MHELSAQLVPAIERGLAYLHQHQYPNGEFCCYFAPDVPMQEWCVPDSTVFPTASIANSLLPLAGHPLTEEMLTRATGFLQYQMMPGGVWNYFTSWHPLYKLLPPDADTTACASSFLRARQVPYPAADSEALLMAHRNTRGLFYTWFTLRLRRTLRRSYWRTALRELKNPIATYFFWRHQNCSRNDLDSVVNANVLYLLGPTEDTRPAVAYLIQLIADKQEEESDNWYHSPLNLYYALARCYFAGVTELAPARPAIISRIEAATQPSGQIGESVLESALAACALLYWGCSPAEVAPVIHFLLAQQRPTGDWPRSAYFYSGRNATVGWGSEEFTTGFCLEALARYQQALAAPATSE